MKKIEESLIEKFKHLEAELIKVLSETKHDQESLEGSEKVSKQELKLYVKKVAKVSKLFSEYEAVAEKIEKLTKSESSYAELELSELANAVVDLREENAKFVDEIQAADGEVKVVKKKKQSKSKEL